MKTITFRAREDLIAEARSVARAQGKTLNEAFRDWLVKYTADARTRAFDALMEKLRHVNSGRHFTRDEMNER
jgi:predicted transcriptional regulator